MRTRFGVLAPARRGALAALLAVALGSAATAPAADDPAAARERMVREQIAARGVRDPAVLAALRRVPRHLFVPAGYRSAAYADHPLPIGEGQTISQPYIVALMTEALALRGTERVLEIGTGSGYQAAVLAAIVPEVSSIEIVPALAARARRTLDETGNRGVRTRAGDGWYGWPEAAPFDAIVVTAAANHVPPPLLEQLRDGGRLVIPLGPVGYTQTLTLITRSGDRLLAEQLGAVMFVPLTGGPGRP